MSFTPVPPPFADELTPGWARFVNTIPGVTNDSEKELINFNIPQGETLITIPFAATKASSDLVLVGPVFVNVVDDTVISDITFSVVNFSTSAMTIVLSSAVDTANYYLKTIVFVVGAFPSTNSSQSGLSGGGGIATSINFGSILNLPTTLGGYGITDAEMSLGDPSVDGYVLSSTTGGTRSWISPSSFSLPSQVNQSGKFLQSNGTDTAWISALDLNSAQVMTNKVIDGAANTLQNIPRTALEGYATSTLSLTDPNADSVPYWNDLAGEFQWTPLTGIAAPASIAAFMGTSTVRGINKEIHIAVRTDGKAGTGTAEDPFDGSGTKFDTKLSSLSATTNVTIHLGPGTFTTDVATSGLGSAFYVKNGWRIIGAGMYATTVQMTGSMAGQHFDHEAFKAPQSTPADNVTISDLTIDCNFSALNASADTGTNFEKNYVAYGIGINGSNNLIEHVRVINQYGTFANGGESFGIALGAPSAGGSGDIIRFCVVELPHGTYAGAPFALGGYSTSVPLKNSKVHNCKAIGTQDNTTTATFNTGGVNMAAVQDCDIYDNEFIDCRGIAYSDTLNVSKVRIFGNKAVRAWQGIGFMSDEGAQPTWTKSNIEIFGNYIDVLDRTGGENSAIRFANGTNIKIGANNLFSESGGVGTGNNWTVLAQSMTNITVCDLTAPDTFAQVTGSNTMIGRNRTMAGAVITGLEDNANPSSFTTPITVTATPADEGDERYVLTLAGNDAYNAPPRTSIRFLNKYNVAGDYAAMGGISVVKENGTDGNYAGALLFQTRANGGTVAEKARLSSAGGLSIGSTTDSGAGNLLLNGLTASNYVKTDGSKVLVSAATIPGTDLSLTDVTTNNASTSNHGFLPKLDNTAAHFLNGQGGWTTPNGSDNLGLTPTAVKTANYTAAAGDLVPCDTTSAGFTVTLPTAPADKSVVAIKHVIQGGTNTVSLATGGSDVFNKASGGTSGTLTLVNQGILLQYKASGAIWYAIADDIPLSGMDARFATAAQGTLAASAVQPSTAPTLTATNFTGTASININGTVGATTANTGEFTNLTLSGNQSAAAWTTSGLRLKGISGTLTDTTSSGTVAAAYTNKLGGNTIAASSATTFTDYISGYFSEPVQGTNVTLTNKWALGADSLYVGTSNPFKVTSAGATSVASTTDSTTSTTGSLKTAGGLGVAKAVNVGTTLGVTGATTLTGGVTIGSKTLAVSNNLTLAGTDGQIIPLSDANSIRVYVKNVTVLTSSTPADIATITLPSTVTRYSCPAFSEAAVCFGESISGTNAAASFTVRDAASGGGSVVTNTLAGPTATNAFTVANGQQGFHTSNTLYIRQTANSANSGTVSFYVTLYPLP